LWGPRGGGKTTLLQAVGRELGDVHHALSVVTSHLDDITETLERAYAEVPTQGVKRRTARSRLWWAADADPGCLLLDHVTKVSAAMKGWLRRLRGLVTAIWQIVLIRMVAWMGRGARGPAIALSLVGVMALRHIFLIAFIPGAITVLTPSHGSVQAGKIAIGLYIFHTVVYAAASYPVGMLGDRMSMPELHVA
jgi:hypothetical protein